MNLWEIEAELYISPNLGFSPFSAAYIFQMDSGKVVSANNILIGYKDIDLIRVENSSFRKV